MARMKVFTLGINGFVPPTVLAAIGEANHIRQASVLVVAANKLAAAELARDRRCGYPRVSDPEFRQADHPIALALRDMSASPAVYVSSLTSRAGDVVVAVDGDGPRRVGLLKFMPGRGLAFVPDED